MDIQFGNLQQMFAGKTGVKGPKKAAAGGLAKAASPQQAKNPLGALTAHMQKANWNPSRPALPEGVRKSWTA